jgi:putative ATP-dependent endonuclease of OLD family
VSILGDVYRDTSTIATAKNELETNDVSQFGARVLTMADNVGKGWFAILLGKTVDHHTFIPDYILDAILFAHGPVKNEVLFNILNYRIRCIEEDGKFGVKLTTAPFARTLNEFRKGNLDFSGIRDAMLMSFPADEINSILARL